MYNLLIGYFDGSLEVNRILEYTDSSVKEYVAPQGKIDIFRISRLPTLMMPEKKDYDSPQMAQVGYVEDIIPSGRKYGFRFIPLEGFAPIPTVEVHELDAKLGITNNWELNRTHWAVKEVDLYRVLAPLLAPMISPQVFSLPKNRIQENLVAVMMPFDRKYDETYKTLKEASSEVGMDCVRVDDIWENNSIMQDIASLICRAQVVVADLTGKNPNVFYETGIAHTLGREVILITQNPEDVPFDLRHLRNIKYLANEQGLMELKANVIKRLKILNGI